MSKFDLITTIDYEMPNNACADVTKFMVEPTRSLLDIMNSYAAKLTIMFEIAEMWAFEKDANKGFSKHLGYNPAEVIRDQLLQSIKKGHDVQLHLHPQWLNAKWGQGGWTLDYSRYRLTDYNFSELVELFRNGKEYLESLLCPYSADYACIGFRAGNWITQPPDNYLRALHAAGLRSDSSVFKWGYADTASVFFDYRNAFSNVLPWIACWDDINRPSPDFGILEVPIYTEAVNLLGLLSAKRLRSASYYFRENRRIAQEVKGLTQRVGCAKKGLLYYLSRIISIYPKKLDYCKLSWKEMVGFVENIHQRYAEDTTIDHIPIVMIGHSKEPMCSSDICRFLEVVSTRYKDSISFSTYREFIQRYKLAVG
jgi:hypothetical protein